jgi:adenylate cyclase
VTMLHRLALTDFARSRQIFLDLADRVPCSAAPHSMLAKWHVLQLVQGWSKDPAGQASQARAAARRAVELDPLDAFGLAVDGLVSVHGGGDLAIAESRYREAIQANPQEPLAWALTAGLRSYQGQGKAAVQAADQSMRLSPLDPERFLFEAYAALACIVAGDYARARRLADSSVRNNALHAPSQRLLVIAMALGGDVVGARQAALQLMRLEPDTTIDDYRRRYPGRDMPHARLIFDALAAAGVPH